jgi:hypothetical protein
MGLIQPVTQLLSFRELEVNFCKHPNLSHSGRLSESIIRTEFLYTLAAGVKFLYLSTVTLCDR